MTVDVYDQDTLIDDELDPVDPALDASFDITVGPALDASFDITRRVMADDTDAPVERSLQEPDPRNDIPTEDVVYEVMEKGSKRGGRLLVGSDGFTYGVKRENKSSTMWTCSVRSKKLRCPATVLQAKGDFQMGPAGHLHPADLKLPFRVKVSAEAKALAAADVFIPGRAIVEDVVMRVVPDEEMFLAPKMDLLKRSSNLHRSKIRPKEPGYLNFELNLGYINSEEFLVKDINEDGCRHIIFATKYQLQLLAQTRCWYMDGTFKVVPDFLKPRGQLLSIHGFVRRDGQEQQFPLVFVLMSSRQEGDYVKVFQGILSAFPTPPSVEMFMVDFEQGAWKAIHSTFPDANIKGCCFHWTQALWRSMESETYKWSFRLRPIKESPEIKTAALTSKERAQRWRNKLKQDPEFYEKFKERDRLREKK